MNDTIQRRKNGERCNDLLQKILDAEEDPEDPLDDFVVFLHMGLFLQAGSETVSNTLSFCFIELMQNSLVYAKLVDELRDAFPSRDHMPDHETLRRIPYLNAVLNETMRMYLQAGQGIRRIIDKDVVLGGYLIPKERDLKQNLIVKGYFFQTKIIASTSQVARDPTVWSEPEKFKSERFLEEDVPIDAFMPFSSGSRNCIGKNYAYMEMRLALGILVHRFHFEFVLEQEVRISRMASTWSKSHRGALCK
ncbi:cytochrome P450 [Jimgerdemannia flammicorona]|uniref:Cytochrome P450 n=1 Tax=Jimgerdemannia flammicorona TaxID=994334 RepID=A0A433QGH4_9FUNG|nr:cytochrome P450 [Jimgerdemannia flammicorona]